LSQNKFFYTVLDLSGEYDPAISPLNNTMTLKITLIFLFFGVFVQNSREECAFICMSLTQEFCLRTYFALFKN